MNLFVSYLLSAFLWGIGLFNFLLWGIIILLISFIHTGKFFELLIKSMCKAVVFFAGIKVRVHGINNLDKNKQYIVMLNHVNMFDHFMLYSFLPLKLRGLEEESHFKWPIYGWVDKRIGNIPISRNNPLRAKKSLERAVKLIKERKDFSILILPEGTRSKDGYLGKFKKGGFLLALETGLDILPIVQVGGFKVKNKNSWIIKPGIVDVYIEKPLNVKNYSNNDINKLINDTRKIYLKYLK